MPHNEKTATNCFDSCLLRHNCFGGYLNETPECDQEILRIMDYLRGLGVYTEVRFSPSPKQLQFFCRDQEGFHIIPLVDGYLLPST